MSVCVCVPYYASHANKISQHKAYMLIHLLAVYWREEREGEREGRRERFMRQEETEREREREREV